MAAKHLESTTRYFFYVESKLFKIRSELNLASSNQYVSIDLTKLDHNIEAIRSCLAANTQLWPVIKDDAYGHGAIPIAKYLSSVVHGFCVVRSSEGVRLREAGIRQPILVFEPPDERSISLYSSHHLIASVSHSRHLDLLETGCSYHVNIDTGMNRLGASVEELPMLLEVYKKAYRSTGSGCVYSFLPS